jgi:hypothetical protein
MIEKLTAFITGGLHKYSRKEIDLIKDTTISDELGF